MDDLQRWTAPWDRKEGLRPGDEVLVLESEPEPWMLQATEIREGLALDRLQRPQPGWVRVADVPDHLLRLLAEQVYLDCDAAVGCCGALANPIVVDEAVAQLHRTVGIWRVAETPVSG